MIRHASIRTKLLAMCILLILLAITGISSVYYLLTKQDKQRESQERIRIAFDIILDDFHNKQRLYARQFEELIANDKTLNWAAHTYNQDPSSISSSKYIISSLARVATELKNAGKTMFMNEMALYAGDGRLLIVYQALESEQIGGYVRSAAGHDTYLPMGDFSALSTMILNNRPIPDVPLPADVAPRLDLEIPDAIRVDIFREGDQIGFKVLAPIHHQRQKVGTLVNKMFFTQAMVERYASLSKTQINFFSGDFLRLGTLPEQERLDDQVRQQRIACADLLKPEAALPVLSQTVAHHVYYQGACAFGDLRAANGTISVNLSQKVEQQGIRRILTTILIVAGLSVAVCVGLVYEVLVPWFTTPIITLTDASQQIARGELRRPIDTSGRDELGVLARSFAHMRDEIRHKIEELEDLNAALDQRVEERTAQLTEAHDEILKLNEQLKEENLRMSAELDIARRLQAMVLPAPRELEELHRLDLAGFMQPADEVGGDYYDILPCGPHKVCIGIGDVTGHGLESGVLMLMAQTAIRTLIDRQETDPVAFLGTLNRVLYGNIRRMRTDKSMTLAFVQYEHNRLTVIGQHEEVLVVRKTGRVERVDTIDLGFPVGMVADISVWIKEAAIALESGDGIVLYTDGITEAYNEQNAQYGVERLCAILGEHWPNKPSEEVKQAVIKDVIRHIGAQKIYDDMTLVVLKVP